MTLYFYFYHNLPFINCENALCNNGLKNAVVADSFRYVYELYDFYKNYSFFEAIEESRLLTFFQSSYPAPNNTVLLMYYMNKLNGSINLFFFINIIIYSVLMILVSNEIKNKNLFLICMSLNLYIFGTFSLPNKEIFGYLAILSFVGFMVSNKFYFLLFSLVLSLLSRIILTYFIFCAYLYIHLFEYFKILVFYCLTLLENKYNFKNITPKLSNLYLCYSLTGLLLLLYVVNIIYFKIDGSEYILKSFNINSEFSLNIYLNELSKKGLSFITIWIKILENLFGGLISNEALISTENRLNKYSEYLHFTLVILIMISFFKNFKFFFNNRSFICISFIYLYFLIIFSMQSFIMHRYIIGGFPLLVYIFTLVGLLKINMKSMRK